MKKTTLTVLLILITNIVFPQKDTTIYFSNLDKVVLSIDSAANYYKIIRNKNNTFKLQEYYKYQFKNFDNKWHERASIEIKKTNDSTYLFTNLNYSKTFSRVFNKSNNGYIIQEFSENYLTSTGFSYLIFPLIKEGTWTYYYPNTFKERKVEIYKENIPISNRNWDEYGDEIYADIFDSAEEMPEYNGGMEEMSKFLTDNITYPKIGRIDGVGGTVYITFIVMEDGSLNNIEILRGVSKLIDDEAMRVVKLMDKKWKPGKINGKPVKIRFNLPISFNLR